MTVSQIGLSKICFALSALSYQCDDKHCPDKIVYTFNNEQSDVESAGRRNGDRTQKPAHTKILSVYRCSIKCFSS